MAVYIPEIVVNPFETRYESRPAISMSPELIGREQNRVLDR